MNMREILEQFNVPFKEVGEHHHATTNYLQVDCPSCSPHSETYRLGINPRGWANCWTCGSLPLIQSLMDLTGQSFPTVKDLIADLPSDRINEERPRGRLKMPSGIVPGLPIGRKYLRSRGFDPIELERLWGLMYIGLASRLAWRVFIPIHYRGQVVSWTTRSFSDKGMRYISAKPEEEAIKAKSLLLGQDFCRHAIIVVEGPFDVFRIGPGAGGTGGIGFTRVQVAKIAEFPVRVVAMDNEPKAQQRAGQLCDALKVFPGKTYNVKMSGKDPGEASEKEVRILRRRFLE